MSDESIDPAVLRTREAQARFRAALAESKRDTEAALVLGVEDFVIVEMEKMLGERDEAQRIVREREQMAGNVLARIHRDGGHYVAQHGWQQAADDAEQIVLDLRTERDEARDAFTELRDAFATALDSLRAVVERHR